MNEQFYYLEHSVWVIYVLNYNQRDILYLFEKGFSKYELYYVVALCFDYFNIEERKTR